MSIHINAKPGDIAPIVLLTGDPLRAKFIAETHLENVECYNTVRNMFGYTGIAGNGTRLSVQGSGMGQPSLSIYVNELIDQYGVRTIVRVGTAGSLQKKVKPNDIVIAVAACTDSGMNTRRFKGMHFAPIAHPELLGRAMGVAGNTPHVVHVGNIFATDVFYGSDDWKLFAEYGVLAVEMETAELYTIAAKKGVRALTILSISDTLAEKSKPLSAKKRERAPQVIVDMALKIVGAW